jgi:hypothetical protein
MPDPFADYLQNIQDDIDLNTGNEIETIIGDARDAVDPDANEVDDFLTLLVQVVTTEAAHGHVARAVAIGAIQLWIGNNPANVWVHINPHRFAFELAIRVAWPKTLDQGKTDYCGPTGILFLYAQTDPGGFALFGMSILQTGSGMLRQTRVVAMPSVRNLLLPLNTPSSAEFVMLSAIRNSVEASGTNAHLKTALQSMPPLLLCGWFRRMGYINIVNEVDPFRLPYREYEDSYGTQRTLKRLQQNKPTIVSKKKTSFEYEDGYLYQKRLRRLMEAKQKLDNGNMVIFVIDTDVLNSFTDIRGLTGSLPPRLGTQIYLHYAALVDLTLQGGQVDVTLQSYGETSRSNVALGDFLPRFFGYISAHP